MHTSQAQRCQKNAIALQVHTFTISHKINAPGDRHTHIRGAHSQETSKWLLTEIPCGGMTGSCRYLHVPYACWMQVLCLSLPHSKYGVLHNVPPPEGLKAGLMMDFHGRNILHHPHKWTLHFQDFASFYAHVHSKQSSMGSLRNSISTAPRSRLNSIIALNEVRGSASRLTSVKYPTELYKLSVCLDSYQVVRHKSQSTK